MPARRIGCWMLSSLVRGVVRGPLGAEAEDMVAEDMVGERDVPGFLGMMFKSNW